MLNVLIFKYTAWEQFRDLIPENERGSFVDAYRKRLNSDDKEVQVRLALFGVYAIYVLLMFFLNFVV